MRRYNFLAAAGEVKGQYVVTSINATTDLKSARGLRRHSGEDQWRQPRAGAATWPGWRWARRTTTRSAHSTASPSVYIAIKGTPSANPLDVIKHVRAALPELEAQLPPNLKVVHRL